MIAPAASAAEALARPIGGPAGLLPVVSATGSILVVAALVGLTPIGSGDYGQWLMVSRAFSGESVPAYRALGDVPPLVPLMIGALAHLTGDGLAALHITAFLLVVALGAALFAVGWAVNGRAATGLIVAVLGLLVTDQFLDLLAFGGLLQVAATAWIVASAAAFMRSLAEPRRERAWWVVGSVALFATCLTHVPTATAGMPVAVAAAGLAVLPIRGASWRSRARRTWPLAVMFGFIAAYWGLVIAPASLGFVANPASLSYRGPGRALELLVDYPPTLAICLIGVAALALLGWRLASRRTPLRAPGTVLLLWALAAWAAFGLSAVSRASTDYPRFVPILLTPLAIAAAWALTAVGDALRRRRQRTFTAERGLAAIALSVALVAPFSVAGYQTEASGYQLTDAAALEQVAAWADAHLIAGSTVLAPVREAKWIEGLTGRATLFSSQVRYAFRPVEWSRSLAADALFRSNLTLVNEDFGLMLTDGVATASGQPPRSLSISANHGGENVELLRQVAASSVVVDAAGATLARLPSLQPAGMELEQTADRLAATTHWTGLRGGSQLAYSQGVELQRGSASFVFTARVDSPLPVAGMRIELRPPSGVVIVGLAASGDSAVVTFGRLGDAQPQLRISAPGGTIALNGAGGLDIQVPGRALSVTVTDLTAGGATTSLRLLDPAQLVGDYGVGAAILRHDASYEARRARLELLGFHVAEAAGPYVVMIRSAAVAR
ncbi:MAG TPA: hypothetical protein VE011_04830 [Candidatus Dormibacteraeota bacterium]|nr:hypothetical protein [Candidatus Dormibacteraeota bacterium]